MTDVYYNFALTDGDGEETHFCYDGHISSLEKIWNWLHDDFFPPGSEEKEVADIEMYVEDPNEIFFFKCAVIRERTETGGILHDGYKTFSWGFSPSQTKATFDEKVKEIFPFVDSPTNMIFIGTLLIAFIIIIF